MQTLNEAIEAFIGILNKLDSIPATGIILLVCLFAGWFLKGWPWFPNNAIPVVVILIGTLGNTLLFDFRGSTLPLRICIIKAAGWGFILGVLAWQAHDKLLRHIEDKIPFLKGWIKDDTVPTGTNPTQQP